MSDGLHTLIRERLESRACFRRTGRRLVLGACAGKEALDDSLSNNKAGRAGR